ncbi:MAG: succinate dehydrogenase assembly factor 2 [Wolbachia endosymbiont of Meromenopon meropis]|nr:succinate dehydrogenase assembly factor 2 [Wolbachia endosymbiont of Meromenopon meropis]
MADISDISLLRKKLIYRSWHRGCKEFDLLFGCFALKHLHEFSIDQLTEYENIINLDDYELYYYVIRKLSIPCNLDGKVMNLIVRFIKTYTYLH